MALAEVDYTQAGELKIGQVGIANLRVRTLDVAQLIVEMRERVQRAPKLFARAAVVIDFGGLSQTPDVRTASTLIDGLRDAGVIPVALAYGTREIEQLANELDLPLLAKFRAQYETENAGGASAPTPKSVATEVAPTKAAPTKATPAPGQMRLTSVRSGQQLYAEQRDLTVMGTVGAGAEVMADGSVHIYGALRGRALAGAQGDTSARVFCREFHAELVAVAGHYKVMEEIPKQLRGKAVQVWLENDTLRIEELT